MKLLRDVAKKSSKPRLNFEETYRSLFIGDEQMHASSRDTMEVPVLRASDIRDSVRRLRVSYDNEGAIRSTIQYTCPSCLRITVGSARYIPPALHADGCRLQEYIY